MARNTKTTAVKTPHNVIQFRAPLMYVEAFRAAAAKRGLTLAQAGADAMRCWLDKERAPIQPLPPPQGGPSTK